MERGNVPSESFYKANSSQSIEYLALHTLRQTPNAKRKTLFLSPHLDFLSQGNVRVVTHAFHRMHGVTFRLDHCLNIKLKLHYWLLESDVARWLCLIPSRLFSLLVCSWVLLYCHCKQNNKESWFRKKVKIVRITALAYVRKRYLVEL